MIDEANKRRWTAPFRWGWKVWVWLMNRRASQAIKNALTTNQIATAALATSVAAAGIGGYATYNAREAQSDADRAIERLAAVEGDIRRATVALAQLEHDVEVLTDATEQGMKNLRTRAGNLADRIGDVRDEVRALPITPDARPAAERAIRLAQQAAQAAQKAQNAAMKAQEGNEDPEARKAASEAERAAYQASLEAKAAEKEAKAARDKIDALPPGYEPFPRIIQVPSDTRTNNAPPYQYTFTIDLPAGEFIATLTGAVTHTNSGSYAIKMWSTGQTTQTQSGTGNEEFEYVLPVSSNGGTKGFAVWLDGNLPGPGNITFDNLVVTIEEAE